MICGNTGDFIDHPLPEHFVSAHGASHNAWAPCPPPSKSGARFQRDQRFSLGYFLRNCPEEISRVWNSG